MNGVSSPSFWKRFLVDHFHYSKLCFFHRDWRAFVYTPWLPQTGKYQLIYTLYRWIISLYFFCWLVATWSTTYGPKYLIYLSNWNFMLFNAHLAFFALCCTYYLIKVNLCNKEEKPEQLTLADLHDPPSKRCYCCSKDTIPWYLSIVWCTHYISTGISLPLVLLYWTILANDITYWSITFHVHLFVAVPGLVDCLLTGLPWRLYHMFIPMSFGATYIIFTAIYYAAGGTDVSGQLYIYPILDYRDNPISAAMIAVVLVFVLAPFVHFVFWCLYFVKTFFLFHKLKHSSHANVLPPPRTTRINSTQPLVDGEGIEFTVIPNVD